MKIAEKTKAHVLCAVTFFKKLCRVCDNVQKFGGAREATDDNRAHALCMLGK
jgi:hypothetical protein